MRAMKLRTQLGLVITLIAAALLALVVTGARITVPIFGRDYVLRFAIEEAKAPAELPRVSGPAGDAYPLVVLDPGHGGFDYGATGDGYLEKDLVLGLANALRQRLLEAGDVRVAMIRDDDSFVPLERRPQIARELSADLYISIHADSAGEQSDVSGASIYTLSSSASSAAAARFAARENAAGAVNGVDLGGRSAAVNDILVDLSRRRTQEESVAFAQLIERSGRGQIEFHPQVQRSASLIVLRAPDIPSVLFESGFVTNARDAQLLASREGQERFAQAMASAIRTHFSRKLSSNVAGDR